MMTCFCVFDHYYKLAGVIPRSLKEQGVLNLDSAEAKVDYSTQTKA